MRSHVSPNVAVTVHFSGLHQGGCDRLVAVAGSSFNSSA